MIGPDHRPLSCFVLVRQPLRYVAFFVFFVLSSPTPCSSSVAQLQASLPHAQPSPAELADMSQRAHQVVRLLEEYRRLNLPENERAKMDSTTGATSTDDHRPPKRPWEDMSQDGGGAGNNEAASFSEVRSCLYLLDRRGSAEPRVFSVSSSIPLPRAETRHKRPRNKTWNLFAQNARLVRQVGVGQPDSRKVNTGREV